MPQLRSTQRGWRWPEFAALLLGALLPTLAAGQPVELADQLAPIGNYREVFLENPKVSGNNLVGLRWSASGGRFDPNGIRVKIADRRSIGTVCVEISSKDGRYSAENAYDLSAGTTNTPAFSYRTKYPGRLAGYAADDVSVIVHKDACDSAEIKPIIPAVLGAGGSTSGKLQAFVNADPDRVTVALLDGDRSVAGGTCAPAGTGVQIAYSAQCVIDVPATLHGAATLRVMQKERFRTVPTNYPVLLP